MMLTTRARLFLVLPPFFGAFYYFFSDGLNGSDTEGLIAFLLASAGLFVVVQATLLRGRLTPSAVLMWNTAVISGLGLLFGVLSRGEEVPGLTAGLVLGIVTGFTVLWLGSLVQLRRHPRVFLSYRRADTAAATAGIYSELSRRYHSRNVFMDVKTIRPGRDFREEITRVMGRCDAVFVIIGTHWLTAADERGRRRLEYADDPVRVEVETALAADLAVVPVLVGAATMPTASLLPESLGELTYRHAVRLHGTDIHADLIPRFEAEFRPYTTDSVQPPPRVRLRRRVFVGAVVLALLAPFGLLLVAQALEDVGRLDHVAAAPDGIHVAAVVRGGLWAPSTLRVWNSVSGSEESNHRYSNDEPGADTVIWSPDGRHLAIGEDDGIITIRAADTLSEERKLLGYQGTFRVSELDWSPDGQMIAAADDTGTLRVWGVHTGQLIGSAPLFSTYSDSIDWSPTSDAIAVTCLYFDGVVVVDMPGNGFGPVHKLGHTSAATSIGWSPGGTALAAGFYDEPSFEVYQREGAELIPRIPREPIGSVSDIAWSPDGRAIATAGGDIAKVIDTQTGDIIDQLLIKNAYDPNVVWAPASDALASADEKQIIAYPLKNARPSNRWKDTQDNWGSRILAWTADDRVLTQGGADHIVRVWQVGSAEPVRQWVISPLQVLIGSFS